jgi:hypothetical protein
MCTQQYNCSKNYNRHSDGIEIEGAVNIFHRSEAAQNVVTCT